ncbi:MAG: peptide chain release factor N(5)-glutamine methyltransferase [Cyanobacteriota bacterium]
MRWRQELIQKHGGALDALDWLLEAAAGISPSQLGAMRLNPSLPVECGRSRQEVERLWRRHLGESVPLQYLIGRGYWRQFTLEVGPAVLIPRPETELMIDLALELTQGEATHGASQLLWADLGTGSGCLAMGLAQAFPESLGFAVDISPEALALAQRNLRGADFHGRVRCLRGNWFGALRPWWGQLQLVLANPPYIPSQEVEGLDPVVRDHEPRLALDGGGDGLGALREVVQLANRALAPGGWLLVEHHHDQSEAVLHLLATHGLGARHSHPDLEGHLRFASARRRPESTAPGWGGGHP